MSAGLKISHFGQWVLYITDIRNDMTSFWYVISLLNSERWLAILLVTGVLAGEITEAHLPVMVGMLILTYNILTRAAAVEGISYCGVPDTQQYTWDTILQLVQHMYVTACD